MTYTAKRESDGEIDRKLQFKNVEIDRKEGEGEKSWEFFLLSKYSKRIAMYK